MPESDNIFNGTAFFEGLSTRINTLKELRKAYDEQMAFDFIATQFFQPNENKFSEILAFFLDPSETHGQGDTFLRFFCQKFLPAQDWAAWLESGATIRTEHTTSENRRIDITVDLGKQFIVGIENKIYNWTAEQAQQAEHYCKEMESTHSGQYLLLYLTPEGTIPTEHSISTEFREELEGGDCTQFQCISYREDVFDLLEQWAMACRAATVESFIKDFQKYIQYQYTGVRDVAIEKEVAEYLTANDRYMVSAIHTHLQIDSVWECLWNRSRGQLEEYFNGQSGKVSSSKWESGGFPKRSDILQITHDRWSWFLAFDAGRPFHGVRYTDNGSHETEAKRTLESLRELVPAYCDVQEDNVNGWASEYQANWSGSPQPWEDMATETERDGLKSNKFVDTIIQWYEEAHEAVKVTLQA